MSVKSIKTTTVGGNTECSVCLGTLNEKNPTWVRHTGKDGKKHPLHQTCLRNIFKQTPKLSCPYCKVRLDPSGLPSKTERFGIFLRDKSHYFGVAAALALQYTMSGTRNFNVALAGSMAISKIPSAKYAFFVSLAGAAAIGTAELFYEEAPLFHASVQFGVGLATLAATKAANCLSHYLLS